MQTNIIRKKDLEESYKFNAWAANYKQNIYKNTDIYNAPNAFNKDSIKAGLEKFREEIRLNFESLLKSGALHKECNDMFLNLRVYSVRVLVSNYGGTPKSWLDKAFEIGIRKNHDYGADNIIDFGVPGLLVRLNDKVQRVKNLIGRESSAKVQDEKVEDTLLDIVNYATYADMLSNKIWF